MRNRNFIFSALLATVCLLPAYAAEPSNWNYWRGPSFNGYSDASGLAKTWDPDGGEGSNLKWKREDIHGRSTPIVMNGHLYMTTRADEATPVEGEKVICLNAETGETVWEHKFNVWLSDVPDTRVGWSSCVGDPETGNIYALGVCDLFMCLDGKTGEEKWSVPLHEFAGMLSTYGGRTNFPVIHEDLVIISGIIINWGDYAKPNHRYLAMNKHTGEVVWFNGTRDLPNDTSYSSASLTVIEGQKQFVVGSGDGAIWGFQPRTGRNLWKYQFSRRGIFPTPLVVGDMVFCNHGEENMTGATMGAIAALKISGTGAATKAEEVWKLEGMIANRSAPLYIDGRIYLVDDRCKLWVIDAKTGDFVQERLALGDRKQFASLLYADNVIYALTENGRWAFMEITEDGVEIFDKGRIRNEAFYASPVAYGSKLFFLGTSNLYCVEDPSAEKSDGLEIPQAPAEAEMTDKSPAWIQLVPAEAIVRPGEKIDFKVRTFNDIGQLIEETSSAELSVSGGGTVEGTQFVATDTGKHYASHVTAKVGNVQGHARIRVVPSLPWKFDFNDLSDAPETWVGVRYRHQLREVDGSPALVKVTTIPKGARSRAWLGHSDLTNYTIASDVKGQQVGSQLPDIGLTALGYCLDLQGNDQALEIRSWASQKRMAVAEAFPWKPDVWYRLKLKASIEERDGKKVAVLQGKAWPKDDNEPEEWTVTAEDQSPNLKGSPGLFGKAQVCEIYLDNLEVFANE